MNYNGLGMREAVTRLWRTSSTNKKILSAATVILSLNIVTRLLAIAKELLTAKAFGTSNELDAFLIAFVIPTFLINLTDNTLGLSVIPTFIQVRESQGKEASERLFSQLTVLILISLLILGSVLTLLSPVLLPLIGSGFNSSKLALTQMLFFWLMPTILLNGISTMGTTVLNANERFALPTIAAAVIPLSILLALIFILQRFGIYTLAIGNVTGFALELIVIILAVKHYGVRWNCRWSAATPALKQVLHQSGPAFISAIVMSSWFLIDQSMAAMLSPGSVSALNYANRIIALPASMAIIALGNAATPFFSRLVIEKKWEEVRHTIHRYLFMIFIVGSVAAVGLMLIAEPLIHFLYERGSFTSDNTHLVGNILKLYAIQLPFYFVSILIIRLVSAMRANTMLLWVSAINITLNIVLNYILMRKIGVAGIALSTSIVYIISFAFLFAYYRIKLKESSQ